jgi:hypothetical protein
MMDDQYLIKVWLMSDVPRKPQQIDIVSGLLTLLSDIALLLAKKTSELILSVSYLPNL